MNHNVKFVSSHDPRVRSHHLRAALQIAEEAFETKSDSRQIEIDESSTQWTTQTIPFCWTLILLGDECIGSAAVLPTEIEAMHQFLAGKINEQFLMRSAQRREFTTFECLYLSGVSVSSRFQKLGFGTQSLIHAIETAQRHIPQASRIYCWPFSEPGRLLLRKVRSLKDWDIQERAKGGVS